MSVWGWIVLLVLWAMSALAAYGYGFDHGRAERARLGAVLIDPRRRPTHRGDMYTPRPHAGKGEVWRNYTPRRRPRPWRG